MALILSGTNGITDVNGTAAAPAITGTDTDTGVFFGTNTVSLSTNGIERLQVDSSGNLGLGVTPSAWASPYKAAQVGIAGGLASWGNSSSVFSNNTYNNSGWKYINSSQASMYSQESGGHYWWSASSGTAGNAISFTQAMTLDASGNLGIGTTSPSYKLDISGSGVTGARVTSSGTDSLLRLTNTGSGGRDWYLSSVSSAGALIFVDNTAGSERARIDSSGNLLVGTTTANCRLAVSISDANTDTAQFRNTAASNPYGVIVNFQGADPNNTTSYVYAAYAATSSTWIYRIWSNGTVSARSDARLKKNIEPARNGYLDDLNKIEIVKYNWYNHEDGTPKELGWIAQQVETVFPGLVQTDVADDGTESKSVKLSVFTPMLIKAVQELNTQLKEQQAIITQLQADIETLKGKA